MKSLSVYKMKKNKAKKRRLKIVRTATLLVLCIMIMAVTVFQGSVASGEIREPKTVVVVPGDTLWTLAGQYAPRGMDRRDYLDEVFKANGLVSSIVYPGQEIVLP